MEWIASIGLFILFEWLYRRYGLSHKYVIIRLSMVLGFTMGVSYLQSITFIERMNSLSLLIGLLFIAWVDSSVKRIPNTMLIALVGLRVWILLYQADYWKMSILSVLVWCGGLTVVYILLKQGIGAGDIKLMGVLGFYIGLWHSSVAFLIASALICLWGVGVWIVKKGSFNRSLPLAPFLLIGVIVVIIHSSVLLGGLMG